MLYNPYIPRTRIIRVNKKPKLPPGKYRLGDPGHILSRDDYERWLDAGSTTKQKIRGRKFVVFPAVAAGCYDFERGDTRVSGPIGIEGHVAAIPEGLVREDAGLATIEVEFGEKFACVSRGSEICFGDVSVRAW